MTRTQMIEKIAETLKENYLKYFPNHDTNILFAEVALKTIEDSDLPIKVRIKAFTEDNNLEYISKIIWEPEDEAL